MHCFNNHYHSAIGSKSGTALRAKDRDLLSLPVFHISGFAMVIRTLIAGAALVISPEELSVSLLKKEKITHLSLLATQLYRLLTSLDFQAKELSIKHLLLGGSIFLTGCWCKPDNGGLFII